MEKGKSVATPGVKEKDVTVDTALTPTETTLYRSMTMRTNYLAQDRPDIQYAGEELARGMSAPTEGHQAQETGTIFLRQAQNSAKI